MNVGMLVVLVHGQWEEYIASHRENWVLCSDMRLPRPSDFPSSCLELVDRRRS